MTSVFAIMHNPMSAEPERRISVALPPAMDSAQTLHAESTFNPSKTMLSKQLSLSVSVYQEKTAAIDQFEAPDGGVDAWLTVLGASLVAFSTFGFVSL